jgi:peptidoglycan/LPS O-acetylase OafA/YrhL
MGPLLGITLISGMQAVPAFFVISGFFAALVLNEKYDNNAVQFFKKRLIRLYPIYIISSALIILSTAYLVILNKESLIHFFLGFDKPAVVAIKIFTDLTMTSGLMVMLAHGGVFNQSGIGLMVKSVIPNSWFLLVILIFYIIAPHIVKRNIIILIVLAIGLYETRYLLQYVLKLDYMIWVYYSPLFNLSYCVMGIIAYRIHMVIKKKIDIPKWSTYIALAAIVIYILIHPFGTNELPFVGLIALCLPSLLRGNLQFSYLGALSYPMFLCHWHVFVFLSRFVIIPKYYQSLIILIVTIIISIIILYIEKMIKRNFTQG